MTIVGESRVLVLDDDGIAAVYPSLSDFSRNYETAFLYEVVEAFDSEGFRLTLSLGSGGKVQAERCDASPNLLAMKQAVDRFSQRWIVEEVGPARGDSINTMDHVEFALNECHLRSSPRF